MEITNNEIYELKKLYKLVGKNKTTKKDIVAQIDVVRLSMNYRFQEENFLSELKRLNLLMKRYFGDEHLDISSQNIDSFNRCSDLINCFLQSGCIGISQYSKLINHLTYMFDFLEGKNVLFIDEVENAISYAENLKKELDELYKIR